MAKRGINHCSQFRPKDIVTSIGTPSLRSYYEGRFVPSVGDRMAGITPLFDNLWNEVHSVVLFGWWIYLYLAVPPLALVRSDEEEEWDNKDAIEVGVFPKEYDNFKLEVTWTVVPFLLIVYLAFISWGAP